MMKHSRISSIPALLALLLVLSVGAGAANAQEDFGLSGARHPEEGLLFGGQPTSDQLAAAGAAGYRVLDLRASSEDRGYDEAAEARRLGIEYRGIPVDAEALQRDETYEAFFAALEGPRPVVAHCATGNRVGGLYYAYLVTRRGLPRNEALARAKASGLRSDALARTVDQWLDRQSP
ncbi:MAG TPA: sulfur transferase domain-containing protein [Thermoanaerobaculia bacterium]|nr:sulfur transferase domain-containing protein [Thermoanaerobaculia bacterium]